MCFFRFLWIPRNRQVQWITKLVQYLEVTCQRPVTAYDSEQFLTRYVFFCSDWSWIDHNCLFQAIWKHYPLIRNRPSLLMLRVRRFQFRSIASVMISFCAEELILVGTMYKAKYVKEVSGIYPAFRIINQNNVEQSASSARVTIGCITRCPSLWHTWTFIQAFLPTRIPSKCRQISLSCPQKWYC